MAILVDTREEVLQKLSNEEEFVDWDISWSCWFTFDDFLANQCVVAPKSTSGSNGLFLKRDGSSTNIRISSTATATSGIALPTAGTWMWAGVTAADNSTVKLFLATPTDVNPSSVSDGTAPTGSGATARPGDIFVAWTGADFQLEGKFAFLKIWNATLTDDEIKQERWSARPRRTDNLRHFFPFWNVLSDFHLNDISGRGNDLVHEGTSKPTSADESPPVSWTRLASKIIVPVAAAPSLSIPIAMHHYKQMANA